MRKSLGAVALATSLAVVSGPSLAFAKVTEVDGNRFRAGGLTKVVAGCDDPAVGPVDSPDFLMKRGPGKPPSGQYSSGWNVTGEQFAAGALAPLKSPTTLSTLRISALGPGDELEGVAMVRYRQDGYTGRWVGMSLLGRDTRRGWHAVNAANRTFTWRHYSSTGTVDRIAPPSTIASHLSNYGEGAQGAQAGFLFGCNEKRFYVDALRIVSDDDSRTFDFGGFRTRAELRLGSRNPAKTTITVGRRLDLSGRLFEKYVGDRLAGTLQLQSKPLRGESWKTFEKRTVSRRDAAEVKVGPSRNTAYRIAYPGTATKYENDVSNVLKVVVRMRAAAWFADPTITRGSSYAAVGRVAPRKRAGIQLQRYRDGAWRTVRKDTTDATGRFRITGTAQDAGVSHWRVKVNGGATNADAVSRTFTLTVSTPPTGDGGGNDDPPPPPPPEG